jgi:glutaredoxin 3
MAKVTIYTTRFCPFCIRAKHILKGKGQEFDEISVDGNQPLRQKMTELAGGVHTVPQIWIDDYHVGGCSELMTLDASGKLDTLLAQ